MMPAIRRTSGRTHSVSVANKQVGRILRTSAFSYYVTTMSGRVLATRRLLRDAENFAQVHFACSPSWKELQNAMQPGDEEPAVE